jgi:hypothetical protein
MVRFHQNAGGYSAAFTTCHLKDLKYSGILMKMPKIELNFISRMYKQSENRFLIEDFKISWWFSTNVDLFSA